MTVEEIEQYYTINEDGTIYSKRNHRNLSSGISNCGYVTVSISVNKKKTMSVHRLVARRYVHGMTEAKYSVNHKDGNKLNNHFSNLEWVTRKENMNHAFKNGLFPSRKGENNNAHKYTDRQVAMIKCLLVSKFSQSEIARFVGCTQAYISDLKNGKVRKG